MLCRPPLESPVEQHTHKPLPLAPTARRARLRPCRTPPQVPKPRHVAPCPALRQHLGRGGRTISASPPALAGGRSTPTPVTNRPRVSPHAFPTISPTVPAAGSPGLAGAAVSPWPGTQLLSPFSFQGLSCEPRVYLWAFEKTQGSRCKTISSILKDFCWNLENPWKIVEKSEMQIQFCWSPGEKHYNFCKACLYFFVIIFAWKIEMWKT
jgi:hypothetical protein